MTMYENREGTNLCRNCGQMPVKHEFKRGVFYCRLAPGSNPDAPEGEKPAPPPNPPTHCDVNSPRHYRLFPDMEAIDVIEAALTREELVGYLKGNVLKYRLRAGEKGPPEKCIGKANWYRDRLNKLAAND